MFDYAPFFDVTQQSELDCELVNLGNLYVPTGSLMCCDPFLSHEVNILNYKVTPGSFPVKLCVVNLREWGKRVALAGLIFSPHLPLRWTKATYEMDGDRFSAFRVDAGLACFMDAQTAEIFSKVVQDFYSSYPNGNYYDDILAAEFKRSANPDYSYHAGDWNLHYPIENDQRNIAMFASGLGDGSYFSFFGIDRNGVPAMLVIDFNIIEPI